MFPRRFVLPLALLAACTGDEEVDPITVTRTITNVVTETVYETVTTTEPVEPLQGVITDCTETVGNICPWAGAGYNGYNGNVSTFNLWFSFPMGVEISPYGDPVIADWNNHKLRMLENFQGPGTGVPRTIMGTDFLGDGDPARLDMTEEGALGTTVNLNHPTQHEFAPDGTLWSASWHTHKIRTWDPATDMVHVVAGLTAGYAPAGDVTPVALANGGRDLRFNQLKEIHLSSDFANNGRVYIVDMRNERIRVWDSLQNTVETIVGNGVRAFAGDGGDPKLASINLPNGMNPEPGGAMAWTADESMMFFADTLSNCIRMVDFTNNTIQTFAGVCDEVGGNAVGSLANARFDYPVDLALDEDTMELFVADANNHTVKVIDLQAGTVSTFAGTGEPTCTPAYDLTIPAFCDEQHTAGDGGPAADATLYRPFGVELDLDGNLIISDTYNHRIRIVYR